MREKKKKRIALIINSLSGGGAERTVSNLSRGLSDRYDIDIVVNDDARVDYPYEGTLISLRFPPRVSASCPCYQILLTLRRAGVLRQLRKKRKYSAVISFSELTNLSNVLSSGGYGKTIVSVRNAVNQRKTRGLKQKLVLSFVLPYVCRKADRTVSCSKEIADDLQAHYRLSPEKSTVIYNGLELCRIRARAAEPLSRREESEFAGKKLVVTAGRLTGQKGQKHLLKVVKILKEQGFPVRLVILGEGELHSMLEKTAEELGIRDSVYMPGFVKNPNKYIARADVFVMSSLYEGFCNAILEALACGVPVISTDHETGAREILAPDTDYRIKVKDRIDEAAFGILVPVFGEKSRDCGEQGLYLKEERLMAEAMKKLFCDEGLAEHYRRAARIHAEEMNMEAVCREWSSLIESR